MGLYKGNFGKVFVVNEIRSWFAQPMKDLMNGRDISVEMPKEQKKISEPKTKSEIKQIREQCREILKKADSEITEDDKKILAQYEGAGGLDEENRSVNGVLNEFYTPNNLVQKVWNLVDSYAPNAKSVLEPSSGIGKFAVNRPDNNFTLHEIDETSARIAKILHPNANVIQGAYQEQFFDENKRALKADYVQPKYDVVIGNPPYGVYSSKYKGLGEGKEFDRYEEYFISKGLDALKDERSILAFVVPSGFLNSAEDSQKKLIASKGQLIDAYRLPEGTFGTTDVGTDIILMEQLNSNSLISFGAETLSNNDWFKNHPEKILGKTVEYTDRWGKSATKVVCNDGLTVQDELNKIDKFVSLNKIANQIETLNNSVEEIKENPSVKEELKKSVTEKKPTQKVKVLENSQKSVVSFNKGDVMTSSQFSRLYGKEFDEREFSVWKNTDWEGFINIENLSKEDADYVVSSENYVQARRNKWVNKVLFASGDIYAKIEKQKNLLAETNDIFEKELYSKNIKLLENSMKNQLSMDKIHFSLKSDFAESFNISYVLEDGTVANRNLQEAFILWAQNKTVDTQEGRWSIDFATANISREDFPDDISWSDVINYIDGETVRTERTSSWDRYSKSEEEIKELKKQRKQEAEQKRQARSDTANKLFDKFLHFGLNKETEKQLCYEYNKRFNSYVIPDYSKLPLSVDGMSVYKGESKFKLYDQQVKGISFLCNKGNGILAYDVGVGKTAAGIVATVNQIQLGRSKRPLIIVPNQVYPKWCKDIKELFPNIKVNELFNMNDKAVENYRDEDDFYKLNIPENSITIVTEQALQHLTFTDESCKGVLFEDFSNLLSESLDGNARENAAAVEKIQQVIGAASITRDLKYYFFEKCGFDNLTVDEAHRFKNLWVKPRPERKGESQEYAGIPDGRPSQRALKMYAMTQIVQRNNDNRNVFMLTATPFTNSPLEVYSMLSYVGRERLKNAHINSLRSFLDEYAQTKIELGVNSRGDIDVKQVMKNWKQLGALQGIITEFIDKVDGEEAGIIRPKKFTHVKPLDMSELQKQMREIDEERMSEVKEGNSAAVLQSMTNMRVAMVAPALANPDNYPELEIPPMSELVETSPKLKFVCTAIIDMYKKHPEKGQFMYLPLGKDSHGIIKDYLIKNGIPKEAVEIINGEINNTPDKKDKISSKFNDEKDKLKILIGGQNTSEGMDLNGNSFVMYNCSLGWNPSETIQAEGRIWRQGNIQGHVHIVYPVMNDSIDSVLYQKHDEKRSRINELWSYKGDTLNVEDINPEDLKIELIKDPEKRAKLIEQEQTKDLLQELSRINLRITSFDEIVEKRKRLLNEKESCENSVKYYSDRIEEYKKQNEDVPEWLKSSLSRNKIDFSRKKDALEIVGKKFEALKLNTPDEEVEYLHNLNEQKHSLEDKINNFRTEELPKIIENLKVEQLERKVNEFPIEKQCKILEADILNNLRPMKEVEKEVRTQWHEEMILQKLESNEISEFEAQTLRNAGYENYRKFLDGEIKDLKEFEPQNQIKEEVQEIVETEKEDNSVMKDLSSEPGSLFYIAENDAIPVGEVESGYGDYDINDPTISEKQITEAETKRDEIIFPILSAKESGMYKSFNDFAEHGVFDIKGEKIDLSKEGQISELGYKQLQAAMEIYRDKRFETFRYVLVDKFDGEIKDQLTVKSYLPNLCKVSDGKDTIKQVLSRAEELDCMIVAVHNHPSGNVTASYPDIKTTERLNQACENIITGENRFGGHIILDHNTFNLYTRENGWQEQNTLTQTEDKLKNQDFIFDKTKVKTEIDLCMVADKINDVNNWNDDYIPVVFTNASNEVSGVKLYDKSFFEEEPQRIRNQLQFNGLEAGAVQAFPVITKNLYEKLSSSEYEDFKQSLKNLVENNAVTDVALPYFDGSLSQRFNIKAGESYFNTDSNELKTKPEIKSTWKVCINPSLFSENENKRTRTNETGISR